MVDHRSGYPADTSRPRILLIGLGAHAAHVYLPWIANHPESVRLVGVVDLTSRAAQVRHRLAAHGLSRVPQLYLSLRSIIDGRLTNQTIGALNALEVADGVIISTEPLAHFGYAMWALHRGHSVLSDKPVIARERISTDPSVAETVRRDFERLRHAYDAARSINPRCRFTVSTHRRYHPGFDLVRDAVEEVADETGWPVTSVNGELADGEWRLPHDLLHQTYHPLNQGYGALSHSGYHVVDQFCQLAEFGEQAGPSPDSLTAYACAVRPSDAIAQMPTSRLRKLFPGEDLGQHVWAEAEMREASAPLGEHDVSAVVRLRHNGTTLTVGTISVIHQSVSSRAWPDSTGRDLYRGNGRVRHETWTVHQGPVQTIRIISAQADKSDPDRASGWQHIGGREHFDVHVFRNRSLMPKWERLRTYQVDELVPELTVRRDGGHQDIAKARLIAEFVTGIGPADAGMSASDLHSHSRSHAVWCALNESLARQLHGEPGVVTAPLDGVPTGPRAHQSGEDHHGPTVV